MSRTKNEQAEIDGSVLGLLVSMPEGAEEEVADHLLTRWAGAGDELSASLERVAGSLLGAAWSDGWQPNDIRHYVPRRGTKDMRNVLEFAIANQARAYIDVPDVFVHPLWRQQVDVDNAPLGGGYLERICRAASVDIVSAVTNVVRCLHRMVRMAPLTQFIPPPGTSGATDLRAVPPSGDKTLDRVRALLAKAESTEFAEEAEALTGKAQELITRHSIDVAMIYGSGDDNGAPSGKRIPVDDPYVSEKASLLHVVADANGCRAVLMSDTGFVTVFGFPADIEVVELLFTSLLIQATSSMTRAPKVSGRKSDKSYRRAFLIGFANRIDERLRSARSAAVHDAEQDLGTGVEVVLAGREEQVDALVEATFGNLRKTRARRVDAAGFNAGQAAASAADVNSQRRLRN